MGSQSLEGRVAVVTGASRGMGLAFAEALVAEGARVALVARPSARLEEAAARLGGQAKAFACDIADPQNVKATFKEIAAHFGRIDILVNNAAISSLMKVEKATDDEIRREIDINFAGPIYCTREAIPHLRTSQGDLVFISSESVRMPYPFLGIYAATKGGVETLSSALRSELREDGIRVTTLRAGGVQGGGLTLAWNPETAAEFRAVIERTGHAAFTGRHATKEAMAEALLAVLTLDRDVNIDMIEVRASSLQTSAPTGKATLANEGSLA